MKFKLTLIACLFQIGMVSQGLMAQSALPATGGNGSGSGGSVSYTVGQIDYNTIAGSNGYVNQGVQQPYEFFSVGTEDITILSRHFTLFPNPTSEYVILQVTEFSLQDLRYDLYDSEGRHITGDKITGGETNVFMENLPAAAYYLTVRNSDSVHTFKIIKNR